MGGPEFTEIESRLNGLLDSLSYELSISERREVEEFIQASEYGVALETLCAILVEEHKKITPVMFAEIVELARVMGIRAAATTDELQRRVTPG